MELFKNLDYIVQNIEGRESAIPTKKLLEDLKIVVPENSLVFLHSKEIYDQYWKNNESQEVRDSAWRQFKDLFKRNYKKDFYPVNETNFIIIERLK